MEHPSSLRRSAGLVGLALLLVLSVAGCGSSDPVGRGPVASIGETDISRTQVQDLVEAQRAYLELAAAAAAKQAKANPTDTNLASTAEAIKSQKASFAKATKGEGADTLGTGGAAQVLSSLIEVEVTRQALAAKGGKITEKDLQSVRDQFESSLTSQGLKSVKPFQALFDLEVERRALQVALQAEFPTDPKAREKALREAYAQGLDAQTQYCMNLIISPDQAASQAGLDRINAGEDFFTVGNEISSDKTVVPEGKETCAAKPNVANVFGDALTTAEVGDVMGPADGQGSWLLARVASIKAPTFEESRAQLEQSLPDPAEASMQAAVTKALKKAKVTVDPRYGRWNRKTGAVTAPKDPTATTTTTTATATSAPAGTTPAGN